jgi:hypothetical protein
MTSLALEEADVQSFLHWRAAMHCLPCPCQAFHQRQKHRSTRITEGFCNKKNVYLKMVDGSMNEGRFIEVESRRNPNREQCEMPDNVCI